MKNKIQKLDNSLSVFDSDHEGWIDVYSPRIVKRGPEESSN
jgi:Ca2+-binding EF-hand superfamily protein